MPRFLTLIRIDEKNAPAEGPSPELMERMGDLLEEITKAGVMLDTAVLTPTSGGSRVTWEGGQLSVTDGPFTESKEVIGGYSIEATSSGAPGPYLLQAAIVACHAHAYTYEETDWSRIATLYGLLAARSPSPVVELNRAVAVSMSEGPAEALALVDALAGDPALRGYHLLPSVRGDLLARLGRTAQARAEFERAASLTRNERERELLLRRAAEQS